MTVVFQKVLLASSTTYLLRAILALFAMNVDMVIFLQFILLCVLYLFSRTRYTRSRENAIRSKEYLYHSAGVLSTPI